MIAVMLIKICRYKTILVNIKLLLTCEYIWTKPFFILTKDYTQILCTE